MKADKQDRRKFLRTAALAAGAAAGAMSSAGAQSTRKDEKEIPIPGPAYVIPPYGERSRYVTSVRQGEFAPLQDFAGIITPSALHYTVDHGSPIPDIDPAQHRLMIHGLVDRPLIFTVDEVKRFPSVSRIHFLQCAGSSYLPLSDRERAATVQQTHGKTSCSEWTGVPLALLLKEVGLQASGTWLVAEGAEWKKHSISIPIGKAMGRCACSVRAEWRADPPRTRLSAALACPWLGRRPQCEIPQTDQSGRPSLHDQMGKQRLYKSQARWQSAMVPI